MLSKKDKEWIRKMIRQEFRAALFRDFTIEKTARGPGEQEKKIETENMNLLDLFAIYLPRVEGALRGVQEDADKARNRATESMAKIDVLGQTILSLEDAILTMARFGIALKDSGLLDQLEKAALIEPDKRKALPDESTSE